jgi:hypothetical protein
VTDGGTQHDRGVNDGCGRNPQTDARSGSIDPDHPLAAADAAFMDCNSQGAPVQLDSPDDPRPATSLPLFGASDNAYARRRARLWRAGRADRSEARLTASNDRIFIIKARFSC